MQPTFRGMNAPLCRALLASAFAALAVAPAAHGSTFSNTSPIQIPDEAAANPWPSTVSVFGMIGEVTDVEIALKGLSHTHLDDVGVVAQAPGGQSLLLMNGVGPIVSPSNPTSGVVDVDLRLDDEALLPVVNPVVPLTGSYQPANYSGIDNFTSGGSGPGTAYSNPGPVGTATLASTFDGLDPNGNWKLWVHDFAQDDVGNIADGWSLDVITDGTDNTAPVTTITSGPSGTIGSAAAAFAFVANEPATFECKLDGGAFGSCTAPAQYTGLAEGPHTFTVRATDTANNVEVSPPTRNFTVDLADPPPGGGGGGGGGEADLPPTVLITDVKVKRAKRTATVTFTGADDKTAPAALRFTCALDGKPAQPCSSPVKYKKLKPGKHKVEVVAIDGADNRSAPATETFKVKKP